MTVTPTDIVNRAIQIIGNNQPPVTGNLPTFDGSAAGISAGILYTPCVQTVAREWGYDFSRNMATLTASGNTAPFPWAHEYLYPTNGIQVRQLMPATLTDANDPLPVNWTVGNATVSAVLTKVIWSDLASAHVVFTNQPSENLWDAGFAEAVVRLLASELAMALAGKPDTARDTMEQAQMFGQMAHSRDS
jgi:hypothetical protein